jgi:hypothetical protein
MQRLKKVHALDFHDFTDVLFVRSLQTDDPQHVVNFIDLPAAFHSDGRRVSACSRYVMWLYGPGSRVDNNARHVEIWTRGGKLYFFKSKNAKCQSVVVEDAKQIGDLFASYDIFGTIVVLQLNMCQQLGDLLDNTQVLLVRATDLLENTAELLDACLERHQNLKITFECLSLELVNYGSVKHKNRVQINRAQFSDANPNLSAARYFLSKISDDVRQVVNVKYG